MLLKHRFCYCIFVHRALHLTIDKAALEHREFFACVSLTHQRSDSERYTKRGAQTAGDISSFFTMATYERTTFRGIIHKINIAI